MLLMAMCSARLRLPRRACFLPFTLALLLGCPQDPEQSVVEPRGDKGLHMALRAAETKVRVGQPVPLVIEVRNTTRSELTVPPWDPWRGLWSQHPEQSPPPGSWSSLFELHIEPASAGTPAPTSPGVVPVFPLRQHYLTEMAPGEKVSTEFDLRKARGAGGFPLKPGTYKVWGEYVAFHTHPSEAVWRLVSNSVLIQVLPSLEGKKRKATK